MRNRLAAVARVWLLALLAGAPSHAEEALTNDDVVRLTSAGLGPVVIVAKIESSATAFDTSVDALVVLANSGVDDAVVAAMVATGDATGQPTPARVETGADHLQPEAVAGSTFRDVLRSGGEGPEMVVIPAGRFLMGCLSDDDSCVDRELPVREVTIAAPFALSVYEVTFDDYDRFTDSGTVGDAGWGRARRPVINVRWTMARAYVAWLSEQTGEEYRLPTEAEWEYAARAGATTQYAWGNAIGTNLANCKECGSEWDGRRTAPVGSFAPNAYGLHDMHGNVLEWVEDCVNDSYFGAPTDGRAWLRGDCASRIARGGAWNYASKFARAGFRFTIPAGFYLDYVGFRVARTLGRNPQANVHTP